MGSASIWNGLAFEDRPAPRSGGKYPPSRRHHLLRRCGWRLRAAAASLVLTGVAVPAVEAAGLQLNWTNRATSQFTAAEEAVVDVSLNYWMQALSSPPRTVNLEISKGPLDSETIGEARDFIQDPLGNPVGATIVLADDVDFYVDPTPMDNSEFVASGQPAHFRGRPGSAVLGKWDMLALMLHELGHSLGFTTSYDRYFSRVDPATSRFQGESGFSLPLFFTWEHLDDDFDLLGEPGFHEGERSLISPRNLQALNDAFDYDQRQIYGAAGGPVPVPDGVNAGPATVAIVIPKHVTIRDLDVALRLTHPSAGDVTATLTSPAGTTVTLVNRRGGSGDDLGTDALYLRLDDGAVDLEISEPRFAAPFAGTYSPEQPLSALDGQDAFGTWTLTLVDHVPGNAGELRDWSLIVQEPGPAETHQWAAPSGETNWHTPNYWMAQGIPASNWNVVLSNPGFTPRVASLAANSLIRSATITGGPSTMTVVVQAPAKLTVLDKIVVQAGGVIQNDGVLELLGSGSKLGDLTGGGELRQGASGTSTARSVRQRKVSLEGPGSVLAVTAGPIVVDELFIAADAQLDLIAQDLVLSYSGASPLATIQQWILDGALRTPGASQIISTDPLASAGETFLVAFDNAPFLLENWRGTPLLAPFQQIIVTPAYFGDLNLDGLVDAADYLVIDNNFGGSGGWLGGDANLDGQVDAQDYVIVDNAFGKGQGMPLSVFGGPEPVAAVPEPPASLLAGLASLLAAGGVFFRRACKSVFAA